MKTLLNLLLAFVVLFGATIVSVSSDAPGVYAELWFNNDSGEVAVVSQADVYNNLTLFERGEINFLTFVGNDTINITYPGVYEAQYTVSFGGGANNEIHFAIGINGVEARDCHIARVIGTGGDVGNAGGHCIITLAEGDLITLMYENEGNTANLNVQDANINLQALI